MGLIEAAGSQGKQLKHQVAEIYPSLCLFLAISATPHQITVMSFTWMLASLLPEMVLACSMLPPTCHHARGTFPMAAWHHLEHTGPGLAHGGFMGQPRGSGQSNSRQFQQMPCGNLSKLPAGCQHSWSLWPGSPPEMPTGPCHPTREPRPHTPWPIGSGGLQIENVPNVYWLCPLASKSFGFTFPHKESYSDRGRQSYFCTVVQSVQHLTSLSLFEPWQLLLPT